MKAKNYLYDSVSGRMSSIGVIFEIFARNPPSIAIALGALLLLIGYSIKEGGLITAGWVFFIAGFILQVLWLVLQR